MTGVCLSGVLALSAVVVMMMVTVAARVVGALRRKRPAVWQCSSFPGMRLVLYMFLILFGVVLVCGMGSGM